MFWTIVGALIFVFFIAPLILQVVLGILEMSFDTSTILGCVVLVVLVILLLIIF